TQYHQKRYGASKLGSELDAGQVLVNACHGRVEPLSGYLRRQLDTNAIFIESDNRETGDIELSGREDQFPVSGVKFAKTDSEVNPVGDRGDSDYSNGQRDISDSASLLNPESWLGVPGKTLYEIEIKDERTRKTIDGEFELSDTTVQAGHDQFVPEIQHGHESVREAEQAANYSSDGLEQTSAGLERANREVEFIQQQTDFNLERIRGALKKKRVKQLDRFKTEINLVEYATSIGYEYQPRESSPNSALLRHNSGDKIVIVTNTQGHGIYFSFHDDKDQGTIIDFVQQRNNFNLGEVRKELRPWLLKGGVFGVGLVAKPEPMGRDKINECLQRQQHLNQSSLQQKRQKLKQSQQSQLEP
ncbi:MAG: hypothetical protein WBM44_12275, partial [Waterburya sp.]